MLVWKSASFEVISLCICISSCDSDSSSSCCVSLRVSTWEVVNKHTEWTDHMFSCWFKNKYPHVNFLTVTCINYCIHHVTEYPTEAIKRRKVHFESWFKGTQSNMVGRTRQLECVPQLVHITAAEQKSGPKLEPVPSITLWPCPYDFVPPFQAPCPKGSTTLSPSTGDPVLTHLSLWRTVHIQATELLYSVPTPPNLQLL